MTVTLRRDDGREQSFRIVGEDEADPSRGTVSYVSPLARAVLTHGPERRLRSPAAKPSYWTCAGERSGLTNHSRVDVEQQLLAVLRKTLGAVLDRFHRDLGTFPPDDFQFFVLKLVSCDEELLKLLLNRL